MRSLFRPLTKRDAVIASVIVGIAIVFLAVNLIKDIVAGLPFDDLKNDIILLAFAGFLESGMLTIAISKDKEEKEEAEEITDGSDEDAQE
ncbi:MAG: hypothetical protein K6A91_06460 [Clostridia bacterium]|nr:hypothetical protein [Clostridia bacterium]